MAKLTLAQLERHLFAAADILRGTMDAAEYRDFLLVLLFLKRVNDEYAAAREEIIAEELAEGKSREKAEQEAEYPENYLTRQVMYVPEEARWDRLAGAVDDVATQYLQPALTKLETQEGNQQLRNLFSHVNFNRIGGGGGSGTSAAKLADKRLAALIEHFGSLRLRGEDFEFPDVIGAAYEYLLKDFADSAGAKGGEFYTPRSVVRMMVELARPQANHRVYDPCVGSGGMLIHAKEYVEEHGGDSQDMGLAGQDANSGSWVMATMNMLFHGAKSFSLKTGDTLGVPQHLDKSYDIVLSNPPFSMDYRQDDIADLKERMWLGQTSERGKADLMFLQHMLYMARDSKGGSVFTVMPHGVLFRGGEEQKIREQLVEKDLLEAVIGLAPNLFYGTGIPACVLVLRAPGRKDPERRGKVLFINADREFHADRAQNVLLPEHVEKIVSTFHAEQPTDREIDRFSREVRREELAENDYNLNIRRYVDNTPPPEPQDVRAHVTGGVPRSEVEAKKPLLDAYGIRLADLFVERPGDPAYVDFPPEGKRPDADRLAQLAADREQVLRETFTKWWESEIPQIEALAPYEGDDRTDFEKRRQLADLRAELIASFRSRLLSVGLLDEHALSGAVAGWWQEARNDLKALLTNGFEGVVDGWVETVETMLEPEPDPWTTGARKRSGAERRQAYAHKVVPRIAEKFLRELAEADKTKADLDARVKAAEEARTAAAARDAALAAGEEPEELEPSVADALLSEPELKALKRKRTEAGKAVKTLEDDFWPLEGRGRVVTRGKPKKRETAAAVAASEPTGQTALDLTPPDSSRASGLAQAPGVPGLHQARDALSDTAKRDTVLAILREDLAAKLEGHVIRRRRELVDAYAVWETKYAVSLRDLEAQRAKAAEGLDAHLKELGYAG